jgi:TfoX/Sxy family transcriptional regulator of competence genes
MAYNTQLATRLRALLARRQGMEERKMFGGIVFMLNGNMCCGVDQDNLMVRVSPQEYDQAVQRPHARVFDLTGKPMKGFVLVSPAGYRTEAALKDWVAMGSACARALPAKTAKKKSAKK